MKKILLILFMVLLISSCFNSNEEKILTDSGDILTDSGDILTDSGDILINTENLSFNEDNRIILNNYTINKVFYEDNLLGDIMKQINISDFENMKLLKNKGQDINNNIPIKGEILDIIFQNLINIKAYRENDISICDRIDYNDFDLNSFADYCIADYYLVDLFYSRDIKICDDFNKYYEGLSFMGIEGKPKENCIKIHGLLVEKDLTEGKIEDRLKIIFNTTNVDDGILLIFNAILLEDKICDNIDTLSMKIKCLDFINEGNIFDNFFKEIYPQLINTKYLYN